MVNGTEHPGTNTTFLPSSTCTNPRKKKRKTENCCLATQGVFLVASQTNTTLGSQILHTAFHSMRSPPAQQTQNMEICALFSSRSHSLPLGERRNFYHYLLKCINSFTVFELQLQQSSGHKHGRIQHWND